MEDSKKLKDANLPVIFIIGGPGCGKGTQCELIVNRYGYTHLSTGDLLRDEVSSKSDRGKRLELIMERGELVPLEEILELLKEAMIRHLPHTKGFLIDGYPRTIEQAKLFEDLIYPCTVMIYFDVPDETMIKRLQGRALTSGRVDDNEDTIKKRLQTFHEVSRPVIECYKDKCRIIRAEDTPNEIFKSVEAVLDELEISHM